MFWTEAARLLLPQNTYESVGFEVNNMKSFDDVVVFHRENKIDCRGETYNAEYYQVKFHVDYKNSITGDSLMDPAFIGATTESFLQKVKNAHEYAKSINKSARFILVSPWSVESTDILGTLVRANEGELLIDKLSEGGDRSETGKLRNKWIKHLSLNSYDELKEIIKVIRIQHGALNFNRLKRALSDTLMLAGLTPIDEIKRVDPYPQLIRKLHAEGKSQFNGSELRQICENEKLIQKQMSPNPDIRKLGIKSFYRFAEDMKSETDNMLSLLHHFDGRPIKSQELWNTKIIPEIKNFITSELSSSKKAYEFHLDTHMTCAICAGYFIDSKLGADITVLQKTMNSRDVWHNTSLPETTHLSQMELQPEVNIKPDQKDQALAVSITQMTFDDVVSYIKQNIPTVGVVKQLCIKGNAGNTRVSDGAHATALVEQIRNQIKTMRANSDADTKIHLFISAPNAIAFFLGRLLRPLGNIQLYEHNFDGTLATTYVPSINLNNNLLKD